MEQPSQDAEDRRLVKAIASGDTDALSMLYFRHGLRLLSYLINRLEDTHLAEEILQDVMIAVWKSASTFRGESQVSTWLLSIARNRAINVLQKRQLPQCSFDESLSLLFVENYETDSALQDAIGYLPQSQQETLELIFYYNLTGVEAAQVLDIPIGTVKSRLHRALTTLRRLLIRENVNNE